MSLDAERRAALLAAKLRGLVTERWGDLPAGSPPPARLGWGVALVRDGEAVVLAEDDPGRRLGPSMAWARQAGASALHVLAEGDGAGVLARRAQAFRRPPKVWAVEGRATVAASPVALAPPAALDRRLEPLRAAIEAAGAEVRVEHGVLTGEVDGLEVVRADLDPDGTPRLWVGVGRHDRDAFARVHGDRPAPDALADVVATVAAHRRPGARPHPLNRLVPERALRQRLVGQPGLIGAAHLAPAPPPTPRRGVKAMEGAVASGTGAAGEPLVVVCSVGVDLDLVPFAADARSALAPAAQLVLALPPRDALGVTRALAAALRDPAEVVTVPPAPDP